jgi:hypothetical protein
MSHMNPGNNPIPLLKDRFYYLISVTLHQYKGSKHWTLQAEKKNFHTTLKSVRILPRELVIAIGLGLHIPNELYKFSRTLVLDTRLIVCAFKIDTASYVVLMPY